MGGMIREVATDAEEAELEAVTKNEVIGQAGTKSELQKHKLTAKTAYKLWRIKIKDK